MSVLSESEHESPVGGSYAFPAVDGVVYRFDAARMGRAERTPQGFLRMPAYLTRTGVLTYRRADGATVRELRPASEVFEPQSLATLSAAPLTDMHPAEMVSADNVRAHAIGHVHDDVRADGERVTAWVTIQDARAIAAVERGDRHELSCGYSCQIDRTPGVHNGEPYDQVQRGIVYNHVALLPRGVGRAGPDIGLRYDAACEVVNDMDDVDDVDDVDDAPDDVMRTDAADGGAGGDLVAERLRELGPDLDADGVPQRVRLSWAIDILLDEADAAQARLDAANEEISQLRAMVGPDSIRRDSDAYRAEVQEHAALLSAAQRMLPAHRFDASYGPRDLMLAVVSAAHPDERDWKQCDAAYLRGRFDSVVQSWEHAQRLASGARGNTAVSEVQRVLAPARTAPQPRMDARTYTPDWMRPLQTSRRGDGESS